MSNDELQTLLNVNVAALDEKTFRAIHDLIHENNVLKDRYKQLFLQAVYFRRYWRKNQVTMDKLGEYLTFVRKFAYLSFKRLK